MNTQNDARYDAQNTKTGEWARGIGIDDAAAMAGLDAWDIEWAIEEEGECTTDEYRITIAADDDAADDDAADDDAADDAITMTISRADMERIMEAIDTQREAYYEAYRDEADADEADAAAEAHAEYEAHDALMGLLIAARGE